MYSKELVSKQRQKFWTTFGQYMKPVPGAKGEAVNWLNYKTGIRNIFFRMDAGLQHAIVAIELRHHSEEDRIHYYTQFISLKNLLHQASGADWEWQPAIVDENGKPVSRISQALDNVNVMHEADWPAIIAFFKPRIISLDDFWAMVKDGFE